MNRRGVTLIELLITVVIGSIVFFALSVPFVAERSFWGTGKRQTEAQRDAQYALRTIARVGREALEVPVAVNTPDQAVLAFTVPCGGMHGGTPGTFARIVFTGGPGFNAGQLEMQNACASSLGDVTTIIDGIRSKVVVMSVAKPIFGSDRLVQITLQVAHQLRPNDPRQEDELLKTELFVRNAG